MTKNEMINFIKENPHTNISHSLFADDEYIYSDERGIVYDEKGYVFEDWDSPTDKWSGHNGIRMRTDDSWQDGWYIKNKIITENTKTIIEE